MPASDNSRQPGRPQRGSGSRGAGPRGSDSRSSGSRGSGSRASAPGGQQRSRQRPSDRSKQAEPARFAAYTLLRAVADGAYANLEFPSIIRRHRLDARDAAFATELGFGTLRMQGFYDAVIAEAAARPTSKIDPGVLDVLRLGAHQLLGMRVATHAAADQTVGLARTVSGAGASGFVNAVMRRVSEKTRDEWQAIVVPNDGSTAALATEFSHPEWVVSALRGALLGHGRATTGTVSGELRALLESDNTPAKVSLVARPGLSSVGELVASGATASPTSPFGAVLDHGDPGAIPAIRERRAAVQDEGSQLLAAALAAAPVAEGVPDRWLDLCAGPGGKSGVLGALAVQSGADLVAVEVSEHRADLVRSTLEPVMARAAEAGASVEVRTADGREVGEGEPAAYGRVLVDAPCTGLGALRRRPEARWRRQPSDLAQLGPLQRDLLRSALDAVAPGGLVGYATCSPHPAETTFVVRDVLKKRDDIEVIDAREFFRDASGEVLHDLGDGPEVQLWPHVHGTDAMFFTLLRKKA
ncbi:RsmB/NOP family class I SAM-dependent RNA methyltransferase [Knoellia subterranea]|uniref:rRNA cytosine-C5-methyltransferase n=1 Tax=Knoellia subterranea KCTC 19937 TaxID=1385521 RepID=A0A0A0JN10_9MICO|nr:transcription antitermination factor NusB [Knoellia subterranea]KGN38840.1 rRNA cytosine-C5-methyltransferase [Knoellia subterranea KCTC 19937]